MSGDSIDRAELGKRIKATRLSRNMTAKELALHAEISPSYLSEVERGASAIAGEKLLRIARYLRVSLSFLLEGGGDPSQRTDEVRIPTALAEAAEQLKLSYSATVRLLQGRQSLAARRSSTAEKPWQVDDWIDFHRRVKEYIEE
jgi:transcriptional regulator with XRE-family HTH domain